MNKGISRRMVATTVVLSALLVVIDMTVANVALPNMMGDLGATSEQITWVLTSFSMAQAITIPLTGFLTLRFGERKLLACSVTGFVVMSSLCGQADTLMEMILFRIFQGAFGASVVPLSQSILVQIFPREQRGKAMALYTIGVLVGPVLGPVIGGILTEHMSWRWVFYINVPIGVLCLFMIFRNVQISNRGQTSIDWLLVIAMAGGIGLLQMVLSQGNEKNWFSSDFILFSSIASVVLILTFAVRSFLTRGDIAPVWLLRDRNLGLACLIICCFAVGTFGILQLQPMLMEELLSYPVETTGFIMSPRGIASAVTLVAITPIMDKVDSRLLVLTGLFLNAAGIHLMGRYSLEIDLFWVVLPCVIQGAGLGLVFSTMAKIAFATLAPEFTTRASAVFNLFRTIGASVGIAIVNTYLSYVKQEEWNSLGGALSPDNPVLQIYAENSGLSLTDSVFLTQVAALVQQQSSMLAFVYCFIAMTFMYLIMILLLPLLRRGGRN